MGRTKAWLDLDGRPLIAHVVDALRPLDVPILVSASDPDFDRLGLPRVADILRGSGPISGLHAILSASATPWCFVVACDMPFVSATLAERLWTEREAYDAIVPSPSSGPEPLHAFYSKSCIPVIERALRENQPALRDLLKGLNCRLSPVNEKDLTRGCSPFLNINTPGEWRLLRGGTKS